MSYPLDINNCQNPPSKGGLSMTELKKVAESFNIESKGLLKAEICEMIVKLLQTNGKETEKNSPKNTKKIIKKEIKDSGELDKPIKKKIIKKEIKDSGELDKPIKKIKILKKSGKNEITLKKIESDCPQKLRPNINGSCPDQYPYKFKTTDNNDCCYKNSKSKEPISKKIKNQIDLWTNKAVSVVKKKKISTGEGFKELDSAYYLEEIKKVYERALIVNKEYSQLPTYKKNIITTMNQLQTNHNIFSSCDDVFCINIPHNPDCNNVYKTLRRIYLLIELFNRNLDIKGLNEPNICLNYEKFMPSSQWIGEQIKYINNLDEPSRDVINFYSDSGDEIINEFIRNNYTLTSMIYLKIAFKFKKSQKTISNFFGHKIEYNAKFNEIFNLDVAQKYCEYLVENLELIIEKSPKTDRDIIVFRGVKTNYYLNGTKDIYQNNGFVSTSIRSVIALGFSKTGNKFNYMNMIHIPKGYSCLFNSLSVYMAEFEIILPNKSKYEIKTQFQDKSYLIDDLLVNRLNVELGQNVVEVKIPTNQVQMIVGDTHN